MKIIVNFSHPLSAEAKAQLQERIGSFEEIQVEVQLDLDRDLTSQVEDILYSDIVLENQPNFVLPPQFAAAAYLFGQHFDGVPAIWVKCEGTPPRWVLGGIEGWSDSEDAPG